MPNRFTTYGTAPRAGCFSSSKSASQTNNAMSNLIDNAIDACESITADPCRGMVRPNIPRVPHRWSLIHLNDIQPFIPLNVMPLINVF